MQRQQQTTDSNHFNHLDHDPTVIEDLYVEYIKFARNRPISTNTPSSLVSFNFDKDIFTNLLKHSDKVRDEFYNKKIVIHLHTDGQVGHLDGDLPVMRPDGKIEVVKNIGLDPTEGQSTWAIVTGAKGEISSQSRSTQRKQLISTVISLSEEQYQQLAVKMRDAIDHPPTYCVTGGDGSNCIQWMNQLLISVGIIDGLRNKFSYSDYKNLDFKAIKLQANLLFDEFNLQKMQLDAHSEFDIDQYELEQQYIADNEDKIHRQQQENLDNQIKLDAESFTNSQQLVSPSLSAQPSRQNEDLSKPHASQMPQPESVTQPESTAEKKIKPEVVTDQKNEPDLKSENDQLSKLNLKIAEALQMAAKAGNEVVDWQQHVSTLTMNQERVWKECQKMVRAIQDNRELVTLRINQRYHKPELGSNLTSAPVDKEKLLQEYDQLQSELKAIIERAKSGEISTEQKYKELESILDGLLQKIDKINPCSTWGNIGLIFNIAGMLPTPAAPVLACATLVCRVFSNEAEQRAREKLEKLKSRISDASGNHEKLVQLNAFYQQRRQHYQAVSNELAMNLLSTESLSITDRIERIKKQSKEAREKVESSETKIEQLKIKAKDANEKLAKKQNCLITHIYKDDLDDANYSICKYSERLDQPDEEKIKRLLHERDQPGVDKKQKDKEIDDCLVELGKKGYKKHDIEKLEKGINKYRKIDNNIIEETADLAQKAEIAKFNLEDEQDNLNLSLNPNKKEWEKLELDVQKYRTIFEKMEEMDKKFGVQDKELAERRKKYWKLYLYYFEVNREKLQAINDTKTQFVGIAHSLEKLGIKHAGSIGDIIGCFVDIGAACHALEHATWPLWQELNDDISFTQMISSMSNLSNCTKNMWEKGGWALFLTSTVCPALTVVGLGLEIGVILKNIFGQPPVDPHIEFMQKMLIILGDELYEHKQILNTISQQNHQLLESVSGMRTLLERLRQENQEMHEETHDLLSKKAVSDFKERHLKYIEKCEQKAASSLTKHQYCTLSARMSLWSQSIQATNHNGVDIPVSADYEYLALEDPILSFGRLMRWEMLQTPNLNEGRDYSNLVQYFNLVELFVNARNKSIEQGDCDPQIWLANRNELLQIGEDHLSLVQSLRQEKIYSFLYDKYLEQLNFLLNLLNKVDMSVPHNSYGASKIEFRPDPSHYDRLENQRSLHKRKPGQSIQTRSVGKNDQPFDYLDVHRQFIKDWSCDDFHLAHQEYLKAVRIGLQLSKPDNNSKKSNQFFPDSQLVLCRQESFPPLVLPKSIIDAAERRLLVELYKLNIQNAGKITCEYSIAYDAKSNQYSIDLDFTSHIKIAANQESHYLLGSTKIIYLERSLIQMLNPNRSWIHWMYNVGDLGDPNDNSYHVQALIFIITHALPLLFSQKKFRENIIHCHDPDTKIEFRNTSSYTLNLLRSNNKTLFLRLPLYYSYLSSNFHSLQFSPNSNGLASLRQLHKQRKVEREEKIKNTLLNHSDYKAIYSTLLRGYPHIVSIIQLMTGMNLIDARHFLKDSCGIADPRCFDIRNVDLHMVKSLVKECVEQLSSPDLSAHILKNINKALSTNPDSIDSRLKQSLDLLKQADQPPAAVSSSQAQPDSSSSLRGQSMLSSSSAMFANKHDHRSVRIKARKPIHYRASGMK